MNKLNKISYNPKRKDKNINLTVELFNGYIEGFNGISMLSDVGIEVSDITINGMEKIYGNITKLMWQEIGKGNKKSNDLLTIATAMKNNLEAAKRIRQNHIDFYADAGAYFTAKKTL